MLNLTDEQLTGFKQWKQNVLRKIDVMQAVIEEANPKDYAKNNFYQRLNGVKEEIEIFNIRNSSATYKIFSENIETERLFGSCLRRYICRIERRMEKSALLAKELEQLEEMFEI